jgi:glutamyl-Q tRNA(Asp) synthetase
MSGKSHVPSLKPASAVKENVSSYCGRFAPSPTGPLHFGSLFCALASFLHAKKSGGKWLVRIEDIDTPRVKKNTIALILTTLQAHGLYWDDEVVFQSQRHHIYSAYLDKLQHAKLLYACACSRSEIRARSGSYNGYCRNAGLPFAGNTTRFRHTANNNEFVDLLWGSKRITHTSAFEDPVLKRADNIFAYHLAVVVDDIEQGITHIVRGSDLLDMTPVHLSLYQALSEPAPHYMHVPMMVQKPHEKLSKQFGSPAVDDTKALENLTLALLYMGFDSKKIVNITTVEQILTWAIDNWHPNLIPKQSELLISVLNGVYSKPHVLTASILTKNIANTNNQK